MYDLQRYITTAQQAPGIAPSIAYNANLGTQITSQTISLPVIPSKLIFAVKIPRSIRYGDSNFVRYADTFLPITNIRITLGNRSNLLSSADQQCLYLESLESGLKACSWQSFRGWYTADGLTPNLDVSGGVAVPYVGAGGAPVVLDVAKSLGLSSDLAVGKNTPISLQVIVSYFQNFNYVTASGAIQTFQPELYIIAANPSYFEIARNGASRLIQGGVSDAEVAMVNSMATETVDNMHVPTFSGGDLFGNIVQGLKGLAPMARRIVDVADKGLKMAGYGAGTTGGRRGMKALSNM